MLVVDPTKRITISQIKQHKWMQADPTLRQQQSLSFSMQNYNSNLGDYNEQVLGIMQTLGIDRQRTVEVRSACPLVTTRMPMVQSYICHSVTSLEPVSQCSNLTTLLDFYFFFLTALLWGLSDEFCLLISRVTCNSRVLSMSSSLCKTAATTILLQFITCSWSASRSIEAASYRVVQQLAVSKGRGAPRSSISR